MTTQRPPPGVPALGFAHYIGTGERFVRVTAYFIFAVVTGILMTVTNIALHACECVLDLGLNLISTPDRVNATITDNNLALLDEQDKEEAEEAKACLQDIGAVKPEPPFVAEPKDM